MSLVRVLAQRVVLGVVAAWAVLSGVFLLVVGTRDWNLETILAHEGLGQTDAETIERMRTEYLAERGLDRPLYEQYLDWMGNMFTLQWGESFHTGEAVFPMVVNAAVRTATYVVPGLAVALVVGLALGLYSALYQGRVGDGLVRGVAYLLFGTANFWLGAMIFAVSGAVVLQFTWRSEYLAAAELPFLYGYVLPAILVATTLLAAFVSYARSYSMQYASTDMTKLVRAKGGGQPTVAAHVLRNAAIPLVSLSFVETMALIALSVFVIEALFSIEGLGFVFYNAIWTSDLPVLLGTALVIAATGVLGNVLQDLAYTALDPRVDTGSR